MIKNIIITIIIFVGLFFAYYKYEQFVKSVNTYKELYALQTEHLNEMQKTIAYKDSIFLVKAHKLIKVEKDNEEIHKKFNKIMRKYNMLEDTYIKIKAQRDSIINLKFDVIGDSVDSNKYNFSTNFDLFTITGSYGCSPKFINATLKQSKPVVLNIGIYKNNNNYMAIVNSNSKLLQFDWAYVNFHRKQKSFFDKTELFLGVPINHFGFTGGLYYNNYGILYTKFIDDYNIVVGYKQSLSELWRMIR